MNQNKPKLSLQELADLKKGILAEIQNIKNRPFKVSIVGQTGVGKSSLLNALFNLDLKTDSVKPCTKEIEEIPITNKQGNTIFFYDLPGFGESTEADAKYLQDYRTHLLESDVVLWAIHADNRSVTFDLDALHKILADFDNTQCAKLMSKLTFVLTKADLLYSPPWTLVERDKESAQFFPSKKVMEILKQKAAYYEEQFLQPYRNLIVSRTYNDCDFNAEELSLSADKELSFSADEFFIYCHGYLDTETLSDLKEKYPTYSKVFDRLYDNYQVIPCSATLRFNLNSLSIVIVNKLGKNAVLQFNNFFDKSQLDRIPISKSRDFFNITVYQGDLVTDKATKNVSEHSNNANYIVSSGIGGAIGAVAGGGAIGAVAGGSVGAAIGAGIGSFVNNFVNKNK